METDMHPFAEKKSGMICRSLAVLFLYVAALGLIAILVLTGYGVLTSLAILFLVTCVNIILNVALFLRISGLAMSSPSRTTPNK